MTVKTKSSCLTAIAATIMALIMASLVAANEEAVKAMVKCAADNKIDPASLTPACDNEPLDIPGFKCFLKCVQQYLGVMKADGTITPEDATKYVAEEDKALAVQVTKECIKEVDAVTSDLCEKALALNKCSYQKNPEVYKKSCLAMHAKIMS